MKKEIKNLKRSLYAIRVLALLYFPVMFGATYLLDLFISNPAFHTGVMVALFFTYAGLVAYYHIHIVHAPCPYCGSSFSISEEKSFKIRNPWSFRCKNCDTSLK